MTSQPLGLVGRQEPRFLNHPEFGTSAAEEAVGFCRAAGFVFDEWQERSLYVSLGELESGRWAATEVGLIVPRQNGKGEILAARVLAGLFLFGEQLILHSAHEFKTAREAFLRLVGYITRPGNEWMVALLKGGMKGIHRAHGEEGIELESGARLSFVARSTGSGRGFTGDCVILDEAYALTDAHMAAILSTLSAKSIHGNPQIWYTSSAPLETSIVLHDIRRQGRAGAPRFAYLEWSADSIDDDDALAQANPALGIRISDDFVETERRRLSPAAFARERYGIAPDVMDGRVLPLEQWSACCRPDVTPSTGIVFAVDATPELSYAAVVACDAFGRIEVIDSRPGIGWLTAKVVELAQKHKAPVGVDTASTAHGYADEWERQGVEVVRLKSREMAGACATFHTAVMNRTVQIRTDPALNRAANGAQKRVSGDVWYWARRDANVDVSPLVAASIARWVAVSTETPTPAGVVLLSDYLDED